ncbi:hypothetical protein F4814DRAFT_397482 [Daldinia grandis]|nr:hypothetical protein F4814DRAFT_397482 [Daldinia grandis]
MRKYKLSQLITFLASKNLETLLLLRSIMIFKIRHAFPFFFLPYYYYPRLHFISSFTSFTHLSSAVYLFVFILLLSLDAKHSIYNTSLFWIESTRLLCTIRSTFRSTLPTNTSEPTETSIFSFPPWQNLQTEHRCSRIRSSLRPIQANPAIPLHLVILVILAIRANQIVILSTFGRAIRLATSLARRSFYFSVCFLPPTSQPYSECRSSISSRLKMSILIGVSYSSSRLSPSVYNRHGICR